jgi:DNA-binding MarR family transcriptional regulator
MDGLEDRVASVRRFSRFYTRRIGVLHEGLLGSPLSLAEGRVIWELAQRETATAAELAAELGLDAGYLSRILGGFERRGLIDRRPLERDGRQSDITLAEAGRALYATIDAKSRGEVAALLGELDDADQARLVEAFETAERLLGQPRKPAGPAYILRPHEPGDIGWIIHRHGVLYAEEYGFDTRFEALVAQIAAAFIDNFDTARERCWNRRARRRRRRLGVARQGKRGGRQIAPSLCRALGTRARHRQPARRRMRPLRPPAAVSPDHVVDKRRADFGPPDLSGGRVSPRSRGAAPELRARARRPNLGIAASRRFRCNSPDQPMNSAVRAEISAVTRRSGI